MNRLARESSPYLRQHAHNPVDWYPWGDEAFEKARREDRPVFLSIGYSSCHWCHVMAHESFEDDEIARFLNEHWVSIKVDREERPDVDDVYMTAVQLMTGRGGWPLSAFLLPDKRPFFCGTYFPPDDRRGHPGFLTVLKRLEAAWREKRADLESGAAELAAEVAGASGIAARGAPEPLSPGRLGLLGAALKRNFDAAHGGFGDAPKFPPHLALAWLLRRGAGGDAAALAMAKATLDAMAFGGICDQLGGGFHRYSTDAEWLVPHFEKMLTDNAQLLGLYAQAHAITGDETYARVARSIGDYLLREMRGEEGGFYAGTDADSEGEEGKFFVWDPSEIREVLGEEDGRYFCEWYGVKPEGNFRDEATGRFTGRSILHLSKKIPSDAETRLKPLRERLLASRARRVPPSLDDKRVAGWNALAVSGFAEASHTLSEPRYLEAARKGARFLLDSCRDSNGRLQRTWKDGIAKIPSFLEDEAFLAHALFDLEEADGDGGGVWRAEAVAKITSMRTRFRRKDGPGFAFSGDGNETLLVNGRDLFDKAIPSASGAAAWALARLALKTGDRELAREARAAVEEVSWLMARSPHGMESWFFALETLFEFEDEYGAEEAPVRVEGVAVEPRVLRGEKGVIRLRISVAPGWHLQGPDGLRVEASGTSESEFTFEEIPLPAPSRIEDTGGEAAIGWQGTLEANLSFSVSRKAAKGKREVSVRVIYRACGEGACRPEQVLSLAVAVEVV